MAQNLLDCLFHVIKSVVVCSTSLDCVSIQEINFLSYAGTPIFGVETVTYPYSPDMYGSGVFSDSAAISRIATAGKYFITTVRWVFLKLQIRKGTEDDSKIIFLIYQ